MKTNVTISLDTRKAKQDGTYPLILRLSHRRSTTSIGLGFSIPKEDWDKSERKIEKRCKLFVSVTRVNNSLGKKKAKAVDIITRLDDEGVLNGLTMAEVKAKIIEEINRDENAPRITKRIDFFEFTKSLIGDMRKAGKHGNADVYRDVATAVRKYHGKYKLYFELINYDWLIRYETDYLSRGNEINGLSVNLRTIRAIFNKAIKAGIVDQGRYPFRDYKIKSEETAKRALDLEYLQKIVDQELDEDHPCFHARNYFLASFEMRGMSFIDMAFLKVSDVAGGRVQYKRSKSKKVFDFSITEQLQEILRYYVEGRSSQEYVFPIIKRSTLREKYLDAKWARKRYNRALHDLAELCDIPVRLTSYVSRHSFATMALLGDVPVIAISEMLGHKRLSTTQVYLKSLPSRILDEHHARITLKKKD